MLLALVAVLPLAMLSPAVMRSRKEALAEQAPPRTSEADHVEMGMVGAIRVA